MARRVLRTTSFRCKSLLERGQLFLACCTPQGFKYAAMLPRAVFACRPVTAVQQQQRTSSSTRIRGGETQCSSRAVCLYSQQCIGASAKKRCQYTSLASCTGGRHRSLRPEAALSQPVRYLLYRSLLPIAQAWTDIFFVVVHVSPSSSASAALTGTAMPASKVLSLRHMSLLGGNPSLLLLGGGRTASACAPSPSHARTRAVFFAAGKRRDAPSHET